MARFTSQRPAENTPLDLPLFRYARHLSFCDVYGASSSTVSLPTALPSETLRGPPEVLRRALSALTGPHLPLRTHCFSDSLPGFVTITTN